MIRWIKRSHSAQSAFTIVELIIVIVVIGILAGLIIIGYGAAVKSANDAAVKGDLQKIDDQFKQYALDNAGVFPDTAALLGTLTIKIAGSSYNNTNKSNLYVCLNTPKTQYAVIAMSKSGNRFVVKSESGISQYNGSVTWDTTTGNWATTCTSIDATYNSPSNLAGMTDGVWSSWTGYNGT